MGIEKKKLNGHPILVLRRNHKERFPLSFGQGKALLICNRIDEIVDFAKHGDKKQRLIFDYAGKLWKMTPLQAKTITLNMSAVINFAENPGRNI